VRWGDDGLVNDQHSDSTRHDSAGASTEAPGLAPEQVTALVHAAIPVTAHFGLQVLELRPGYVHLRMPFEPNRNHLGTMYAGSMVALAEIPGGLIPMSMPDLAVLPIATGLQVQFLRAGRGDAFLTVDMDPEQLRALAAVAHREGKAEFELDTRVVDADGELLMTCRGSYQLRPARS
jgi:acyl-coenzyme A thioesterase PaaI-like protein